MEVVTNQRERAQAPEMERMEMSGPPSPGSKVTRVVMLLLVVLVVALVVVWGISSRHQGDRADNKGTDSNRCRDAAKSARQRIVTVDFEITRVLWTQSARDTECTDRQTQRFLVD